MGIKQFIKKYKLKKHLNNNSSHMEYGEGTFFENTFSIRFSGSKLSKIYFKCGKNSLIGGHFVFETETGSISIGDRTQISGGATLICRSDDYIGNDVIIAGGTLIYDHDSHSVSFEDRMNDVVQTVENYRASVSPLHNKSWDNVKTSPITIQDKVWIGRNVIILKGVTIGEGAVVGAGSVVTKDVPAWTVVAGNPAKVVKQLK